MQGPVLGRALEPPLENLRGRSWNGAVGGPSGTRRDASQEVGSPGANESKKELRARLWLDLSAHASRLERLENRYLHSEVVARNDAPVRRKLKPMPCHDSVHFTCGSPAEKNAAAVRRCIRRTDRIGAYEEARVLDCEFFQRCVTPQSYELAVQQHERQIARFINQTTLRDEQAINESRVDLGQQKASGELHDLPTGQNRRAFIGDHDQAPDIRRMRTIVSCQACCPDVGSG